MGSRAIAMTALLSLCCCVDTPALKMDGACVIVSRPEMERDAADVVVTYSTSNRCSEAVLLADRLYDPGTLELEPEAAYVRVDGDLLIVSHAIQIVPASVFPEELEVPFLTRLRPHRNASHRVRIPSPVSERRAYAPRVSQRTARIDSLLVEVGWLPKIKLRRAMVAGTSQKLPESPRLAAGLQRITRSDPISVVLDVRLATE